VWAERARAVLLLVLVTGQGFLGLVVRSQPGWLPYHLLFGITLLLPAAMHTGLRAAFSADSGTRAPSIAAALLVVTQLVVGGFAYLVPRRIQAGSFTGPLDQGLVVLHWAVGIAAVLASGALVTSAFGTEGAPEVPPSAPRAT
jgi:hypothetical protein